MQYTLTQTLIGPRETFHSKKKKNWRKSELEKTYHAVFSPSLSHTNLSQHTLEPGVVGAVQTQSQSTAVLVDSHGHVVQEEQ